MKQLLLSFILPFCASLHVQAQHCETTLQGNVWVAQSGYATSDLVDWYFSFTSGKASFDFRDKKTGESVSQFDYEMYLSDVVPTEFDVSRVGKGQTGRFLVMRQERTINNGVKHMTYIAEILSLTEYALTIRYAGKIVTFHPQ